MEFSSEYENNNESKLKNSTIANDKNLEISTNSSLEKETSYYKNENFNDKTNDLSSKSFGNSGDSIETYFKSTSHDPLHLSVEDQKYVGSDSKSHELLSHEQISPQISVDSAIPTENSKIGRTNQNPLNIEIQETISFGEFIGRMLKDPEINNSPEGLEEMDRRMYDLLQGKKVPISPK